MKRFTFVILHYITIEDTIECISSIKKNITYKNYEIVVVDNASPNDTGKILKDEYKNDSNIHVIQNNKNEGFARGNNLGFKYAKEKLKSSFICLINNDTIIKQEDFIDKCISIYQIEEYCVMGPDIISLLDSGHQNPFKKEIMTYKRMLVTLSIVSIYLFLNYLRVENFLRKIKNNIKETNELNKNEDINIDYKNVLLHGSCLIFSPLYVDRFSGLCDKTFMYGEEEILFYICNKLGLKYLYDTSVQIFHKEGSSTKFQSKNKAYKKLRFYYINKIKSLFVLLKIMIDKKNLFKYIS